MAERGYLFYDFTLSVCNECLKRVDAKIIFEDNHVFMLKRCPDHGRQKVLIATDIDYYKRSREFIKPGEIPQKFNTETHYGCPYDCGLCPDHEQHSCLTLIEVTDRCNLTCPTCYAESSPTHGRHRTLQEIDQMLEIIVANEIRPDVVQLSGGEPTIHPDFFKILDLAKSKPIRHLMLNTNGVRIAKDEKFAEQLAGYMPDFEIYLQFDSFRKHVLEYIRGEDLREVRTKALEHLNKYNLSTTLVITLQKGQNDDEIGELINFALQQKCVRGITFQPTQVAGRIEHFNPNKDRLTLTEVRQAILDQCKIFNPDDIIPVPCNPDALAMAYALKIGKDVIPLTGMINPELLLNHSGNTIVYEQDEKLKTHLLKIFSTGISVENVTGEMQTMLCCLPGVEAPQLKYENVFRIIIMHFMDAYNFDVRAVKKSCVHIVSKEGKIIPFETMNLFYRDDKKIRYEEIISKGRSF